MVDPLLAEIAKLHQAIHAQVAPPANERERQAAHIFAGVQRIQMELIADNVGLRTLELALLYNWLRLATLNRGYDETHFGKFASDLGMVMQRLVSEMKALEAELEDEGPTAEMAQLGEKIETLRDRCQGPERASTPGSALPAEGLPHPLLW